MRFLTVPSSSWEIHFPSALVQPLEVKTVGAVSHASVWKGRQAPELVGMLSSQPVRSCSEPLLSWWDTESVLYCNVPGEACCSPICAPSMHRAAVTTIGLRCCGL